MLTLGFTHKLSRRVSLNFNEAAGTYTRNYLFTAASGVIDPSDIKSPGQRLFDNRVIYAQTSGGLTYQLSARLSFNITRRRVFGSQTFFVPLWSKRLYQQCGFRLSSDSLHHRWHSL